MDQSPNLLQLAQQAINAALCSNWTEAITLNSQIIEQEPTNVDALNRIARAYFELGDLTAAKKNYEESLKHDPYNQIASKFLKKIQACYKYNFSADKTFDKNGSSKNYLPKDNQNKTNTPLSLTDLFIEEPGKTKIINLLKLAEPQKLSYLCPGQSVTLIPKSKGISVTDNYGQYLGIIPDDLSHRLTKLIHGGNKYQALIKTNKPNGLTILIRETYRSVRFKNQPSFLDNSNEVVIYSSDHIVVADEGEEPPAEEAFEEEVS